MTCGRTFNQRDNILQSLRSQPACGLGGSCRLCLDFHAGTFQWMCGATGPLSEVASCEQAAAGDVETVHSLVRRQCSPCRPRNFLALPPAANDEATNSFLYCPLLLHAAGLLEVEAVEAWLDAVPGFADVCTNLRQQTCDVTFLARAYEELLQIPCQHDASMLQFSTTLGTLRPPNLAAARPQTRLALSAIIPSVVDRNGHVPNQLQDLLLQMFGGLGLESDLDSAVTSFRNSGAWQLSLPSLQREASCEEDGQTLREHDARYTTANFSGFGSANRVASEPPLVLRRSADCAPSTSGDLITVERLREHDCVRQATSRFGALRRCAVCDQRMAREPVGFLSSVVRRAAASQLVRLASTSLIQGATTSNGEGNRTSAADRCLQGRPSPHA